MEARACFAESFGICCDGYKAGCLPGLKGRKEGCAFEPHCQPVAVRQRLSRELLHCLSVSIRECPNKQVTERMARHAYVHAHTHTYTHRHTHIHTYTKAMATLRTLERRWQNGLDESGSPLYASKRMYMACNRWCAVGSKSSISNRTL